MLQSANRSRKQADSGRGIQLIYELTELIQLESKALSDFTNPAGSLSSAPLTSSA